MRVRISISPSCRRASARQARPAQLAVIAIDLGQVALQPRQVQILVARSDDEQRVEVRGNGLLAMLRAGRGAGDHRMGPDEAGYAGRVVLDQHPVTDGDSHALRFRNAVWEGHGCASAF